MRFSNYPRTPSLGQDNLFLTDSLDNPGTKTIPANFLASGLLGLLDQDALYKWYDDIQIPVYERRKRYRGKNLGTTVTPLQQARIRQGLFTDMFVGDYWIINEHKYIIADFDYYMGEYQNLPNDYSVVNKHHLTLIPDFCFSAKRMLSSTNAVYTQGYAYSEMATVTIPDIYSNILEVDFGDNLLSVSLAFISGINESTHKVSSIVNSIVKAVIPTISMVFGTSNPQTIECFKNRSETKQLALFSVNNIFMNRHFWVRDIAIYEDPFTSLGFIIFGSLLKSTISDGLSSYYPIFNIQYG